MKKLIVLILLSFGISHAQQMWTGKRVKTDTMISATGIGIIGKNDSLINYKWRGWQIGVGYTQAQMVSMNGLRDTVQTFALDSTNATWAITSSSPTHTFKFPGNRIVYKDRTLTIAANTPLSSSAGAQDLTANRTWTLTLDTSNAVTGATTLYQNGLKADKATTITIAANSPLSSSAGAQSLASNRTWTLSADTSTAITGLTTLYQNSRKAFPNSTINVVPYYNGTTTFQNSPLSTDGTDMTTSGKLNVNDSSVIISANGQLNLLRWGGTPVINSYRADGSRALPTAVQALDILFTMSVQGYDGSAYRANNFYQIKADSAWTSLAASPFYHVWGTRYQGSNTEKMRLTSSGRLIIGNGQITLGSGTPSQSGNAVTVAQTITGASISLDQFRDETIVQGTNDGTGYASYDCSAQIAGSFANDHFAPFQVGGGVAAGSTLREQREFWGNGTVEGTLGTRKVFYATDMTGAGVDSFQYGVYIAALTKGITRNVAIKTVGGTPSEFGGKMTITATNTNEASLFINGGSSYGTPSTASGEIRIGNTAADQGVIAYDDNTGLMYIANTFNSSGGNIIFQTRTSGASVNALTLSGVGAGTFASSVAATGFTISGNSVITHLLAGSNVTLSANYGEVTISAATTGTGGSAGGWTRFSPHTYLATTGDTVYVRSAAADTTGKALFNDYGTAYIKTALFINQTTYDSALTVNGGIHAINGLLIGGNATISGTVNGFTLKQGSNWSDTTSIPGKVQDSLNVKLNRSESNVANWNTSYTRSGLLVADSTNWNLAYTRSGLFAADSTNWNTAYSRSIADSNRIGMLDKANTWALRQVIGGYSDFGTDNVRIGLSGANAGRITLTANSLVGGKMYVIDNNQGTFRVSRENWAVFPNQGASGAVMFSIDSTNNVYMGTVTTGLWHGTIVDTAYTLAKNTQLSNQNTRTTDNVQFGTIQSTGYSDFGADNVRIGLASANNGRIALVANSLVGGKIWNLDNSSGTFRIFRENWAAYPNTGTGGSVALSIDSASAVTINGSLLRSMFAVDSTTYHGSASINTVGAITSGTWQGASISTTYTAAKCTATWPNTYSADQNLNTTNDVTFSTVRAATAVFTTGDGRLYSNVLVLTDGGTYNWPGAIKYLSGHFYGYNGSSWLQLDN